jgi:hypothetical protein
VSATRQADDGYFIAQRIGQAGLKLEKFRVPVMILVIDHIAPAPKAN